MDISIFIANMQNDNLLSPNRFSVTIGGSSLLASVANIAGATIPGAAGLISNIENLATGLGIAQGLPVPDPTPDIMLNCTSVSIPSLNITTVQDKRYGIGTQLAYPDGRELQGITMSFYESNSHKERQFFSQWIDGIYDKTSRKFNFFDNYKKTVVITQYNKADIPVYQCTLQGAFCTHVSEMNRSYQTQDTVDLLSTQIVFHEMQENFLLAPASNPIAAGIGLVKSINTVSGSNLLPIVTTLV